MQSSRLILGGVLAATAALSLQAKERTFTTACYNVDGLPAKILFVSINPDGPQAAGTEKISSRIAAADWDFFSVSEDFAYHNNLLKSLGDYNCGKYRGSVTKTTGNDTDGLEFFWKKNGVTVEGETCTGWTLKYGGLQDGADTCIDKGFRYYCVKFDDGFELDVYIHHMNSGDAAGHLAARASQLIQLADVILASDNHRPILVMGDSNCRWTRDPVAENFFERIEADPRFTVSDPWVDFMWGGWQPSYTGILNTSDLGNQRGEVVDKIFYINNTDAEGVHISAKSFLHDDSFSENGKGLADHYPIVVEFELTDDYTAPEPDVLAGKEVYLRNVATGEFLSSGGAWGSHAMTDAVGRRIALIPGEGENTYALRSSLAFLNDPSNTTSGSDFYMDAAQPRYFTFTPVDDAGVWHIASGNVALSVNPGDAMAKANGAASNPSDTKQQWTIVTVDDILAGLETATEESPVDATQLMRGHDIGVNDGANRAWALTAGESVTQEAWGLNDWNTKTWVYRVSNASVSSANSSKTAWNVKQTVKNLPEGKYRLECQMLADYEPAGSDPAYEFTVNGTPVEGVQSPARSGATTSEQAVGDFAPGAYRLLTDTQVGDDGRLEIAMGIGAHTAPATVCFDNFALKYLGSDNKIPTGLDLTEAATALSSSVYTLDGIKLRQDCEPASATAGLSQGIYIVRTLMSDGKVLVGKHMQR